MEAEQPDQVRRGAGAFGIQARVRCSQVYHSYYHSVMYLAKYRAAILISLALILSFAADSLAKKKPPAHPVNLNTASAAELQQVPGIGPSTAAKILQMRKSYGSFKSVDDLRAIRGIGPKRLEGMRKYLTAGKPQPAQKTGQKVPSSAAKAPAAKNPADKAAVTKKTAPDQADDEEP